MTGYRTFVLGPKQRKALTGYSTTLFTRPRARRGACEDHIAVTVEALRALLADEQWVSDLIGRHTMQAIQSGLANRMVTREELAAAVQNAVMARSDADEAQRRYIQSVETMMEFADEDILNATGSSFRRNLNRLS